MPNKHFCQGPTCHKQTTNDRFLKSRGVVRGRYAYFDRDFENHHYTNESDKYFCSQRCKFEWLSLNMTKVTEEHESNWRGHYTTTEIKRVDNRTELD